MIKFNDDYFIDVDESNYTLKQDMHTDSKDKDGNLRHNYRVLGYYSTLNGALLGLKEVLTRKTLSEELISLNEAIRRVVEVNNQFKEIIEIE